MIFKSPNKESELVLALIQLEAIPGVHELGPMYWAAALSVGQDGALPVADGTGGTIWRIVGARAVRLPGRTAPNRLSRS